MNQYLKAERIKHRHTIFGKLWLLLPGISILCSVGLALGSPAYYQMNQYNWWYTTFLPSFVVLSSIFVCQREMKNGHRAIGTLPVKTRKIWAAKIGFCIGILMTGMTWICLAVIGIGRVQCWLLGLPVTNEVLPIGIPLAVWAAVILVLVSAWQIPLWMFCYLKIGFAPTFLAGMGANLVLGIWGALKDFWWLDPFAIGLRLMCPVLKILPNGLPAVPGSQTFRPELLSQSVILPGLVISIVLFLSFSAVTAVWYQRKVEAGWEK